LDQSYRIELELAIITTRQLPVVLHGLVPFYQESPVREIEETSEFESPSPSYSCSCSCSCS
jgi:hypothetical protein